MNLHHQIAITALAIAGTSLAAMADTGESPPALTRAEVMADAILYREAGMQDVGVEEASALASPEHARAERRYRQLLASTRYGMLVRDITARRAVGTVSISQR